MLFKRRQPADFWERTRLVFWPRRSFSRSIRYFAKRVLRLSATPHAIGAGVAAGVFTAFLPFLGFHIAVAAAIAFVLRGNILASALGTCFGNPLTFPFIWGGTYELGRVILGGGQVGVIPPLHLGAVFWRLEFSQLWGPLLKPMTVGALPLGVLFAAVFYLITRWTTAAFQERRRHRLAMRNAADRSAPASPIKVAHQ